jgi:hypothetical protein
MNVTPHVTRNNGVTKAGKTGNSAIDNRTTRHQSHAITPRDDRVHLRLGQAARDDAQDQTSRHRLRGRHFILNLIGYNLIRIPKLIAA